MIIGIDVGGTHTDAVLIDSTGIVKKNKTLTRKHDLSDTISLSLAELTEGIDLSSIKKINLSTTITTNAIIENTVEKTATVIIPGPGANPNNHLIDEYFFILKGSIDHRGEITEQLSNEELEKVKRNISESGIKTMAVVSKFSTRNSLLEDETAEQCSSLCDFITPGHITSGSLNFPRRINTAYYNSAVWRAFNSFSDSVISNTEKLGIKCEINILKADGGTIPLRYSRTRPVESVLSGPSASIMGIMALHSTLKTSVLLDIGGTTTDISLFVEGIPLIEKDGAKINGKLTSVRSLLSRSIGIGGDSFVRIENGTIKIGPERKGAPLCLGGPSPTVIDAFVFLGIAELGDKRKSAEAIIKMAAELGDTPEVTAARIAEGACEKISREITSLIDETNSRPLYTVHEVIENYTISADTVFIIGAPAGFFGEILKKNYEVIIPEHHEVANAVGAALCKTTIQCSLFADTTSGYMSIPELNIEKEINSEYSMGDAETDILQHLKEHLKTENIRINYDDLEITERTSFKMIKGYYSSGYDLRLKCQIKPGLSRTLEKRGAE